MTIVRYPSSFHVYATRKEKTPTWYIIVNLGCPVFFNIRRKHQTLLDEGILYRITRQRLKQIIGIPFGISVINIHSYVGISYGSICFISATSFCLPCLSSTATINKMPPKKQLASYIWCLLSIVLVQFLMRILFVTILYDALSVIISYKKNDPFVNITSEGSLT